MNPPSEIASDTLIEEVNLLKCEELVGVHTAWYTPQHDENDYAACSKRSLTVGEVADNLNLVQPHRRDKINCIVQSGANLMPLPAYRLSSEEYFLLDGNHRAFAAYIKGILPVSLHVINAKVSRSILPDLWRWEPSTSVAS